MLKLQISPAMMTSKISLLTCSLMPHPKKPFPAHISPTFHRWIDLFRNGQRDCCVQRCCCVFHLSKNIWWKKPLPGRQMHRVLSTCLRSALQDPRFVVDCQKSERFFSCHKSCDVVKMKIIESVIHRTRFKVSRESLVKIKLLKSSHPLDIYTSTIGCSFTSFIKFGNWH